MGYILRFYDKDFDDKLIFKEFLAIVLPLDNPKLRQEVVERENYTLGKDEPLPYNVEYALARILNKEIELFENVEKEKRDLLNRYDYTVQGAFKVIDNRHTRYITFEIISAYLARRHAEATPEDVAAFMRRVDQDLDCKISYQEFVHTFAPIDPKTKTKANYITPTKAFQASAEKSKPSFSRSKSSAKKFKKKQQPFSAQKTAMTPWKLRQDNLEESKGFQTEKKSGERPKTAAQPLYSPPKKSPSKISPYKKSPLKKSPLKRDFNIYDLMEEQIGLERRIELIKQDLVLHNEVTIPRICAIFDPDSKGYVRAVELLDALRKIGLDPEREAAYLLFSRFDKNSDGEWDYENIVDLVTPQEQEYAEILTSRVSKDIHTQIQGEPLTILQRLLKEYLDAEVEIEKRKQLLKGIDIRKAFEECDIEDIGYFTLESVFFRFIITLIK